MSTPYGTLADSDAFWSMGEEACLLQEPGDGQVYDLEERTALFGEAIIRLAKQVPQNAVNCRLIDQLVGAGTSVGANFCEADDSYSRKEYSLRIGTCRKEARETKFFLRMLATAEPALKPEARLLWQEAKELHLIFCAIFRKVAPDRQMRPVLPPRNQNSSSKTQPPPSP
jgi:four helix bundle protein